MTRALTSLLLVMLMSGCISNRRPNRSLTIQLEPIPETPARVQHEAIVGTMTPFGWGMHRKILPETQSDAEGLITIRRIDPERDMLTITHPDFRKISVSGKSTNDDERLQLKLIPK